MKIQTVLNHSSRNSMLPEAYYWCGSRTPASILKTRSNYCSKFNSSGLQPLRLHMKAIQFLPFIIPTQSSWCPSRPVFAGLRRFAVDGRLTVRSFREVEQAQDRTDKLNHEIIKNNQSAFSRLLVSISTRTIIC
jgi:hypothetical protein